MTQLSSEQVLEENGGDPSCISSLSLPFRGLSDVSCLGNFQNLARVDASCNNLTSLEGLKSCINLKWLSVAQNKLQSLKGIESLSKLTVLIASKNMLRSMDEVQALKDIRALILNDNQISSICDLGQLKFLNTIVLSRNPIFDIGSCLKKSNSVTKLSLSSCKIQTLRSSLTSMINLKELRLADNEITSLPNELSKNVRLQNLDLGKNLITRLSDLKVISELRNLNNLNLLGNPLADNPESVKKIRKLVPKLHTFNAKPVEKHGKSEDIAETEPEGQKKRKNPGEEIHPEGPDAKKRKNSLRTDKPAGDPSEGNKKTKKKKKKKKKDGKSQAFDDGESSFMDLVLADAPPQAAADDRARSDEKLLGGVVIDHAKKPKNKKKNKNKKKKKGKGNSNGGAITAAPPVQPAVGVGGPSTWDL
ncbi:leucine-rich repeat (LRR) family protein [Wolffia australiana]